MVTRLLFVLCAVLLSCTQIIAATVQGTVKDSLNNTVSSATVSLQSRTTSTTTTNANGVYRFTNVAIGYYLIFVSRGNVSSSPIVLNVTKDSTFVVDLVLGATTQPAGNGKIIGTVTNEATDSSINNAKLILSEVSGSGLQPIDSTSTDTQGKYTFDSLPSGTYSIAVFANGFAAQTRQTVVTGTTTRTLDFALSVVQTGTIIGVVRGDSTSGPVLAGVKVLLALRSYTGNTTLDSATTNSLGAYTFSNVQANRNYVLTASLSGYVTKTVRHDGQSTQTDTVNFFIIKQATGTISVRVMKQSDSTALSGTQIAVTLQGQTVPVANNTTDGNGWANFSLTSGTYSISAFHDGYAPRAVSNQLGRNENDTVKIYLVPVTTGTKTLKGKVTDSSSNAAVNSALVAIRISVNNATITLFDSTDASGMYVITGIPATIAQGVLSVTEQSYQTYSRSITIGQPGDADTTTLNIKLAGSSTSIISTNGSGRSSGVSISLTGSILKIGNFSGSRQVAVFDLQGRLTYQSRITAPAAITLPFTAGNVYIVKVTSQNMTTSRSFVAR